MRFGGCAVVGKAVPLVEVCANGCIVSVFFDPGGSIACRFSDGRGRGGRADLESDVYH